MTTIDQLQWVTYVTDAQSPAPPPVVAGTRIGVPPDINIPNRGSLAGVPGWRRGPYGSFEWVQTAAQTLADELNTFVDSIPGTGGWKDTGAREVYRSNAVALFNAGITKAAIMQRLPLLYAAAVTNDNTP